ncbi:hypothetical protein CK203_109222 [Vitis vinifera]|uniref:Uncharacterized protein n=1 Tax=Vitis vinifera TaxID=29760 RepID=A0A438BLV6_VITVI|nr:hypothetical protein CK203_109222 [Vitis vinifera]
MLQLVSIKLASPTGWVTSSWAVQFLEKGLSILGVGNKSDSDSYSAVQMQLIGCPLRWGWKEKESEDASAAAGLLEKLSVGDSKTEDKGQEEGSLATKEKVAVDKEEVQAEADKKDETESPA